jgi:hypothetical protein
MLVGVNEVVVLLPPLNIQLLAQHLQGLRGVLVFINVLNRLTSTSAAVTTS